MAGIGCIGETRLLELKKLNTNPLARVLVKIEGSNPTGSIKDRIALDMIEHFEMTGELKPGGTVVENSSGNTAAAVAMICAVKGYNAVLVVPAKCSREKINTIKAFGARVIVAPNGVSDGDPMHYEQIAKRLAKEIPGAVRLDQYNNELNVRAHYNTTGREIWEQTKGNLDIFCCGASTGGTISGVGRRLKDESNNRVKVIAIDPPGSCIYNMVKNKKFENTPGRTDIEGIGKGYLVDCLRFDVIDDCIPVVDSDAIRTAIHMAKEEGILCGMSSGANVYGALELARVATTPTTIVTVLPDTGLKYLSKIFDPEWVVSKGILTEKDLAGLFHPVQYA